LGLAIAIPLGGQPLERAPDTVEVRSGALRLGGLLWRPAGDGPFPPCYSTTAADALAGLAFLRARPDIDSRRVVVVGHSFGGSLSLLSWPSETRPCGRP